MYYSREESYSSVQSMKNGDRPSTIIRNVKHSSPDTIHKNRNSSVSFSPLVTHHQPKSAALRSKITDFPPSALNSKLDINFSLNPAYIKGNINNTSEFLVQNPRLKSRSNEKLSNKLLPKLISRAFETGRRSQKSPGRYSTNPACEIKSSNNEILSFQDETCRTSVEGRRERPRLNHMPSQEFTKIEADSSFRSLKPDDSRREEDLQKTVSVLRVQLGTMRWKVSALEKENSELRGLVQTYKNLITNRSDSEIRLQPEKGNNACDSDENSSPRNLANNENKINKNKKFEPGFHERLSALFKSFSKYKSMYYTVEAAAREACRLLDCGYARILLTNEQVKRIYHEFGGYNKINEKIKSEKLKIENVEAEVIGHKEGNIVDHEALPPLQNIGAFKKTLNNDGYVEGIIMSYILSNRTRGEPMDSNRYTKTRKRKGFNIKDEVLLETYSKIVSLLIDFHQKDWLMKEQDKRVIKYNDALTHIISSRTHQDLVDMAKSKLVDYFDFEGIGLLFYEPREELLFTYDVQKKQDGRFYTTEPLKYPTSLGLSGECMSQNVDLILLNEPRMNKHFQPEIDNVTGARSVKNLIIALLKDEKGQKTGVLQLVNKRNNQSINVKDEIMVRDIQKLLGALVSHITEVYTTVNLSIAMKKTMKKIEETLVPSEFY